MLDKKIDEITKKMLEADFKVTEENVIQNRYVKYEKGYNKIIIRVSALFENEARVVASYESDEDTFSFEIEKNKVTSEQLEEVIKELCALGTKIKEERKEKKILC